MKNSKIKVISLSALFTAVIAVTAWVSVPTPFGINLAFTMFGVGITAFLLGIKGGLASTVTYIALGAAGLPIFSFFSGGMGVLFGVSGGFIWGFLAVALLCGIAKNKKTKKIKYLLIVLSVIICHAAGVIQYSIVTGNGFFACVLSISLPFLLKDIVILFLAYFISKKIKI